MKLVNKFVEVTVVLTVVTSSFDHRDIYAALERTVKRMVEAIKNCIAI